MLSLLVTMILISRLWRQICLVFLGSYQPTKKTAYFIFFIVSVWFMVVSARHNEVQEVSFDNNSQELNSDEKIYQKESKPPMKSELGPEDQRKLEPSRSVRDQIF